MDIPVAFRWVLAALLLLQLVALVPAVRRMRRPDPAVRTEARLDLLDAVSSLTLLAGLALDQGALMLVGAVLLGSVIAVKGFRALRVQRQA
ncbi:hypothetical protein ACIOMM_34995 [Streptomyces sp. NPDC087908]|uniref:hypothetical protein n=1 Tax=unclassified Streptomyces TaxID=2593676 RepID=UPI0011CEAD93|nr:hypothetical protein [Streptomyces sp. adm13(2018)]TXS07975.1 hypothetical protein EAO70_35680 [Streptomyces sp. adm13(2018)]